MSRLALTSVLILVGGFNVFLQTQQRGAGVLRQLLDASIAEHEEGVNRTLAAVAEDTTSQVELNLDSTVQLQTLTGSLCLETSDYPPLIYNDCKPGEILNVIPLIGGITNALKMVLLGAIMSYEEGRCFYVKEDGAHLNPLKNGTREGFIPKYFDPIGLSSKGHPYVKDAYRSGRIQVRSWYEYWHPTGMRRAYSTISNISALGPRFANIEGHELKRIVLRRMWRLLPKYREATCANLHRYNLGDDFMAFSVRRGDKSTEKFAFTPIAEYISEAEKQLHLFHGKVPKIFVATDDCSVMGEFRQSRPEWTFISECDKERFDDGFVLRDIHNWNAEHKDAHFRKFFLELYALATSKVFVGVGYTNVSWWVYFLRPLRHNFILLDKKEGSEDTSIINSW